MNLKVLIERGENKRVEFYRPDSNETVVKPSDTVGKITLLSFQKEKIRTYLEEHKRMVSKDVEKLLRIIESRTRELLKQVVEKGIISSLSSGRSTYYVFFKIEKK